MEAQYALQREVKMVPCMMEEGYKPDGWLGMILGTKLWYGFYGAVELDDGALEGRVSDMARDIGEGGKLVAAAAGAAELAPHGEHDVLLGLKLSQLRQRAAAAGASAEEIEAATDADAPRDAVCVMSNTLDEPPHSAPGILSQRTHQARLHCKRAARLALAR
jgi:hypothetical protein